MQALDLLAELFSSAHVRVVPRAITSPGIQAGLRKGELGKVQGFAIGESDKQGLPVVVFECNNATLEIWCEGESAKEAVKALVSLAVNFPERLRRAVTRERVENHNRDKGDLAMLGRFKGGGGNSGLGGLGG